MRSRREILKVPGVADILGAGSGEETVGESEIRSLRILMTSKVLLLPWPSCHSGSG